uniref:Transcription initiation factor IIA gamma subunit C-terminal domain-containing protein n=1 Tax=Laticauda laticaudata TaxID=8630 RepID=A0A8C5SSA6_LATLA
CYLICTETPLWEKSLQESVDKLIQSQQITPQFALQVLLQNRVNFRGSRNTYRFCDNIWTFMLNDMQFREIVACDGKNTGSNAVERRGIGASEPTWTGWAGLPREWRGPRKTLPGAVLIMQARLTLSGRPCGTVLARSHKTPPGVGLVTKISKLFKTKTKDQK